MNDFLKELVTLSIFINLDFILLLIALYTNASPAKSKLQIKKVFARNRYTCRSICTGNNDLCSVATTTFGEQILCFKSKLLCPTHCVEGRSNKEHLKGQNKSVTTNQPEEVFKFVTTRVSEFSGWERLAECKIDFLIVSLKLLFYSDHINNFR